MTDTKYIDNLKSKEKMPRHSHGHTFEAVAVLKKMYESQDKYLIYEMYDGSETNEPLVLNSSKKKVKILGNLDKDGVHPLPFETVYLNVLHPYTKGWKTYSLSYFDILIQQMVRLCTMESPKEDRICRGIFSDLLIKCSKNIYVTKKDWKLANMYLTFTILKMTKMVVSNSK